MSDFKQQIYTKKMNLRRLNKESLFKKHKSLKLIWMFDALFLHQELLLNDKWVKLPYTSLTLRLAKQKKREKGKHLPDVSNTAANSAISPEVSLMLRRRSPSMRGLFRSFWSCSQRRGEWRYILKQPLSVSSRMKSLSTMEWNCWKRNPQNQLQDLNNSMEDKVKDI